MKIIVIDGNSIINRAFYGIPLLTSPDGRFTNAVLGFLNTYLKHASATSADSVCVCFDLPAPTFRHKAYDAYKAGRRPMPEELRPQIQLLKDVLDAMGVRRLELKGYEADDLLGTLSKRCERSGNRCVLLTGDRDSLQLAGPNTVVKIISTKTGASIATDYDPIRIQLDFGVTPEQLVEVKALMGDKSDNIPGVPGIGEKTALALIAEHGSVHQLYNTINKLKLSPSMRAKLLSGRDSAFMSLELARICRDAPIDFDLLHAAPIPPDIDAMYDLFIELGFDSIIKKLGLSPSSSASKAAAEPAVAPPIAPFPANGAFSRETSFVTDISGGKITALTVFDGTNAYFTSDCAAIQSYFTSNTEKRGHDIKQTIAALLRMGAPITRSWFDTSLAAHVLNEPSELDTLSTKLLRREICSESAPLEPQLTIASSDSGAPAIRAAAIFDLTPALRELIRARGVEHLYNDIELPLTAVMAQMETAGFAIDKAELHAFGDMLDGRIALCENAIYSLAGQRFKINSPIQLGKVLFEDLGLPVIKKTRTGYSTDADVLKKLRASSEIIDFILDYRQLSKLKSTYVDGLSRVISPDDGRIHSSFFQSGTATGRISSSDPNMQNIPVRTELGREMRRMFVPASGFVLIDADYSQIELRILAHISNDRVMQAAFANGEDIHTVTAGQVFGVPPEQVTSVMRSRAKAVNFGIVYGISDFSLADDINVSRYEARQYIDAYLEKYTGVRTYMRDVVEAARKDGFVSTLTGRRRYLPDITSKNFKLRASAERIALNTPIQGTAADVIKLAMVRVCDRLAAENLDARLILQVHDELIVEAREHDAPRAKEILEFEMEHAMELSVKLEAVAGIGHDWLSAKL